MEALTGVKEQNVIIINSEHIQLKGTAPRNGKAGWEKGGGQETVSLGDRVSMEEAAGAT